VIYTEHPQVVAIVLAGLEPERDIKIVFSGIRPGEKLHEELFLAGENYYRTRHQKIFMARQARSIEVEALEQVVLELVKLSQQMQGYSANEQMRVLLPKICYYLDRYQPRADSSADPSNGRRSATPSGPLQPQPDSASA